MVEPIVIERKKLFEHVAAHLEAQILAGKLRPGDQLPPERDLQTSFGVGRPAIREALISLQKAGLVELTNGARARVLMPTASHIFTGMAPAVIRTPMVAAMPEEQVKYMTDKIPMKRCGELEEAAEMIAWIVSPACSFTTGFTFDLSGGRAVY